MRVKYSDGGFKQSICFTPTTCSINPSVYNILSFFIIILISLYRTSDSPLPQARASLSSTLLQTKKPPKEGRNLPLMFHQEQNLDFLQAPGPNLPISPSCLTGHFRQLRQKTSLARRKREKVNIKRD